MDTVTGTTIHTVFGTMNTVFGTKDTVSGTMDTVFGTMRLPSITGPCLIENQHCEAILVRRTQYAQQKITFVFT